MITLSYPGWKDGIVTPVTVAVPVEPMSWRGLFYGYLVWPIGAAAIGAIGWTVWQTRRHAARLRRVLRL